MRAEGRAAITEAGLQELLEALREQGFRTLGPTVRDQAIVLDDIHSVSELPRGWTDEQDAGRYRLVARDDDALFGYVAGPHSWKKFLHPPRQTLWRAERKGDGIHLTAEPAPAERLAFIGVRACELSAIAIQDKVLAGGAYVDPHYRARRDGAFLVAVNCGKAGGTCFCVSMGTGPRATGGFDLALTEIVDGAGNLYIVEAGSQRGREALAKLTHRPATGDEIAAADAAIARAASSMGREMPTQDLHGLLMRNLEHPRWDAVAERCLSCANCTMACPTCFCTSVEDASDPAARETSRSRRWDSCFTLDFSYIHGGSVRPGAASRYRQWMTHKLATWFDQFGSSGCVGCGRCITWCPVGIDITEEARAIRDSEAR